MPLEVVSLGSAKSLEALSVLRACRKPRKPLLEFKTPKGILAAAVALETNPFAASVEPWEAPEARPAPTAVGWVANPFRVLPIKELLRELRKLKPSCLNSERETCATTTSN